MTAVLLTAQVLQAVSLLPDPMPSLIQQRLPLFRQQDMQFQFQGINLNDLQSKKIFLFNYFGMTSLDFYNLTMQ